MEFDWIEVPFDLEKISPREIEESFEDPFAIRLLPEEEESDADARYFCLGKSLNGKTLLSVFWTNGKSYRVIFAREMTESEANFYERKNAELA
ncbi:MAG: BrnT family toxin [Verrucomicrobiota bacterium]